ncbi:unnamed protein product [Alternaria alternata]
MHDSGRDNDEKSAKVKYRVVLHKDLWTEKLADEPLNQRCWILQERILSPRVLHFGHEQLFWECREFVACETYHQGLPASLRNHPYINIIRLQLGDEPKDDRWPAKYVSTASQDISNVKSLWDKFTSIFRPIVIHETTLYAGLNNTSVYQDWYSVVEFYSMGNLTFSNDKLIALSGIAQTIVAVESTTVEDASVSCHGNYRFGRISSGFVKLLGPVASVLWREDEDKRENERPSYGNPMMIVGIRPPHLTHHAAIDTWERGRTEEIMLDIAMEEVPKELTLLCIVETKESNGHTDLVRGLVLQRPSESEHYVRIGVFVTRREDVRKILVNMPRRSITII